MKTFRLLLLFLPIGTLLHAQLPDTDIFLCDMKKDSAGWHFSKPVNLTRRKGYDNQPEFTADGRSFYFVSINQDTTQSDIYRCDFTRMRVERVTRTPESEYSPRRTPDSSWISVVRVDADSGQRFYVIPVSNTRVSSSVYGSDSIGYYTWVSDSVIAMFVLGTPPTLQLLNVHTGKRTPLAASIGRCLKTDSEKHGLYFTDKSDSITTWIKRYDLSNGTITSVTSTLTGSEDFELLPDGSLLLGNAGILYAWANDKPSWTPVADFKQELGDFYRIVVDPTGHRIAVVAYTGEKP